MLVPLQGFTLIRCGQKIQPIRPAHIRVGVGDPVRTYINSMRAGDTAKIIVTDGESWNTVLSARLDIHKACYNR